MIIIAVLGLVVLIVVGWIFMGESSKFVKNTGCAARDGECLADTGKEGCPQDKQAKIYTNDCPEAEVKEGKYSPKEDKGKKIYPGQCCIPIMQQ